MLPCRRAVLVTRDAHEGDDRTVGTCETLFEFNGDDDLGRMARVILSAGYLPGGGRDEAWTIEAGGAVVRVHPGRRWRAVRVDAGNPSVVIAGHLTRIHLQHAVTRNGDASV